SKLFHLLIYKNWIKERILYWVIDLIFIVLEWFYGKSRVVAYPFLKKNQYIYLLRFVIVYEKNLVKGTPTQYIQIYTNCWQLEPDSRPSINQILSRLRSISLEPVLEDTKEN